LVPVLRSNVVQPDRQADRVTSDGEAVSYRSARERASEPG
jgi:hypothetical protein